MTVSEDPRNWREFLKEWDQELADAQDFVSALHGRKAASGLVTYSGATVRQIADAEARLGTSLPPSYKDLLKTSNGFRPEGFGFDCFHSAETVEWLVTDYEDWVDAYLEGTEELALPTVPDDRYFYYGSEQSSCDIRVEYMEECLAISPPSTIFQDHIFLLNPVVITSDGEWEAWSFANWKAGATRYRCLWDMLFDERRLFRKRIAEFRITGV
jgi:hypothetical protein